MQHLRKRNVKNTRNCCKILNNQLERNVGAQVLIIEIHEQNKQANKLFACGQLIINRRQRPLALGRRWKSESGLPTNDALHLGPSPRATTNQHAKSFLSPPPPWNHQKSKGAATKAKANGRSENRRDKRCKSETFGKGSFSAFHGVESRVSRLIERIQMRPLSRHGLIDKVKLTSASFSRSLRRIMDVDEDEGF